MFDRYFSTVDVQSRRIQRHLCNTREPTWPRLRITPTMQLMIGRLQKTGRNLSMCRVDCKHQVWPALAVLLALVIAGLPLGVSCVCGDVATAGTNCCAVEQESAGCCSSHQQGVTSPCCPEAPCCCCRRPTQQPVTRTAEERQPVGPSIYASELNDRPATTGNFSGQTHASDATADTGVRLHALLGVWRN